MATYKTKAIILSSYPYREHDRIVTFYTREYGRLEARARGVKKITSKLAGHLEKFLVVELMLAQGKRWDILAGSRTIRPNASLRGNLASLAAASVCVEAVKLVCRPMASDERVFILLSETLRLLDKSFGNPVSKPAWTPGFQTKEGALAYYFLWQLLHLSGFAPEIKKCINCRRLAASGYFSFEGGGLLCQTCRERDMMGVPVAAGDFQSLGDWRAIPSPAARQIVLKFWENVLGDKKFRSLSFFETLNSVEF